MALLDFIKRNAPQQQSVANKSQEQKPETAKEMYTREAVQEKAEQRPITPEVKAQADRATAAMEKATQHVTPNSTPAPAEGGTNNAQLQKQSHQDKAQSSMSPTDGAAGITAAQEKQPAPEKTTHRPQQTVARRPPSWER